MKSSACWVVSALLSLVPIISCLDSRYANSTTSTSSTITAAPVFCGGCRLQYEVHASVWWPTVYTNYIATVIYTVDKDSGSTIGSSLNVLPNATAIENLDYGVNFTSVYKLRDGGAVQYTYLNSLNNGPATTIIQYNEITMNAADYRNGYFLSTLFYNASLSSTVCKQGYFTINGSAGDIDLPSSIRYSYTTVVPFTAGYNMSNVITYGVDSLASYVATRRNLTIPACTSNGGGGVGTLKVGVTALTSTSVFFQQAQVTPGPSITPSPPQTTRAATSSPSSLPESSSPQPSVSQSPPQSSNSPPPQASQPSALPETPGSESPVSQSSQPPVSATSEPPVIASTPTPLPSTDQTSGGGVESTVPTSQTVVTANPGTSGTQEVAIITTVVSRSSGLQTIVATIPDDGDDDDSISSTIVNVVDGPSGLQTLTTTTNIPIASYIASLGGIDSSNEESSTSTDASGTSVLSASASGRSNTTSAPIEFTAAGNILGQMSGTMLLMTTFFMLLR